MKKNKSDAINFENISNLVSLEAFEQIKTFVLRNGDRQTYRNYDNNNPHYQFEDFEVFLASDIGQSNINNDPKISDFNQLTIADWEADIRYYTLIIVREGDLEANKVWVKSGMQEKQVYLVDTSHKGLTIMKDHLQKYIKQINK
ncbi:MAG: hypothetical protein ACFB0B_18375 [Thermonemataceae bacterium]